MPAPFLRHLGGSSLMVSAIGLGCVTFGREIERTQALLILDHAYERGIRLFDTAEKYSAGASETIVGEWLRTRGVRKDIVLATKLSVPLTKESIRAGVTASLHRLGVDAIDLYQLHSWDAATPLEETLDALHGEVARGRIREVGCSNFAAWQLCRALWLQQSHGWQPMASVQPIYNLAQREAEAELMPCCRALKVGILSYSPLGAGFLTGKYIRDGAVPKGTRFDVKPGHQTIYFTDEGYRAVDRLRHHAAETGISAVQLALSWVFRRTEIATVLIGAREVRHVDQAFEARRDAFDPIRTLPGSGSGL